MSQEGDICYIHKIAFVKKEVEEPIPFAGIMKFVEYKCPMCQTLQRSDGRVKIFKLFRRRNKKSFR